MRRYEVLLPLLVHTEDGSYAQHEIFEKDFSAEDEAENVSSGLLGIVPIQYKVIGESEVYEHKPGETFELALPLGNEQQLADQLENMGYTEKLPEPKKAPARKKKEAKV